MEQHAVKQQPVRARAMSAQTWARQAWQAAARRWQWIRAKWRRAVGRADEAVQTAVVARGDAVLFQRMAHTFEDPRPRIDERPVEIEEHAAAGRKVQCTLIHLRGHFCTHTLHPVHLE